MKMSKASNADIEMALELSGFVEEIAKGLCPKQAMDNPDSDEIDLDEEDPEQLKRVIEALKNIVYKGSIFRVTFGMSILIDPRNELIDPDSNTLEPHPKVKKLEESNAELLDALKTLVQIEDGDGMGITGLETAISEARAIVKATGATQ